MAHRLACRQPGMGQQADATGQVPDHGHLLAIEQRNPIPTGPSPGNGRGETGIEIGRHRKGD